MAVLIRATVGRPGAGQVTVLFGQLVGVERTVGPAAFTPATVAWLGTGEITLMFERHAEPPYEHACRPTPGRVCPGGRQAI